MRVTPIYECRFSCVTAAGAARSEGDRGTLGLRGRVVAADDPLARAVTVSAGRWFDHDGEAGAVVSAEFLTRLGYPRGERPAAVGFRSENAGGVTKVPILGVVDGAFPLGHTFVLTADYERFLALADPDVRAARMRTGPLGPAELADRDTMPAAAWQAVRDFCARHQLNTPRIQFDPSGQAVWEFAAAGDGPGLPLRDWRLKLEAVRRLMAAAGTDPGDRFAVLAVDAGPPAAPPPRAGADWVAVYATDPDDLAPVADAVERNGLRVDRGVILQLGALDRTTRANLWLLRAAVVLLGGLALLTLVSLIEIRSAQKVGEIGLLKVMGLGRWRWPGCTWSRRS